MKSPLFKKVCVIDDDEHMIYALERIIKRAEVALDVQSFQDPEEALTYLKENKDDVKELPEVILLDINMPTMDAWEFLEAFEPVHKNLALKPVLYLMSSLELVDEDKDLLNNEAVHSFLLKPLTKERLCGTFFGKKNV